MEPFLEVADRLLEEVESRWSGIREFVGADECDRQLILGYVHAFRRFRAIRRLLDDERPSPEAVMVLTRSLVSVTHRSLYLVASDDADERRERLKRFLLLAYREEKTRLEGLVEELPELEPTLKTVRDGIARMEEGFEREGWSLARPIFPNDEQLAKNLGLAAHYEEVYRTGSADMHYSAFSALGAFAELKGPSPPITLYGHDPWELRQTAVRAIVVYADFLARTEPKVQLGLGPVLAEARGLLEEAIARSNREWDEHTAGATG